MPNRLAHETSPYLLQHQNNPVDWFPWGPEALTRAKAEEKPIFLSVGYSACHWCHVMEHESFENPHIAAQLNAAFVCIKVDREERPDIDQIYMHAVQLMTGRGGWPMSVFLTPDLKPFFGGTYWPPVDSRGMPGFGRILHAVEDAWKNRREAALTQADELTAHLQNLGEEAGGGLGPELLSQAEVRLSRAFDYTHGGFGSAPKFPHSMDLQFLLRQWKRRPRQAMLDMVTLTLDKMAAGGIYDHLGGGFARYSVDERWLVPHFEKMLYDNALLTLAYLESYCVTGHARHAQTARETCDYILAYMTDPLGGFHSTEDADSEGEEGKFYCWKPAEIAAVLGPERAGRFCDVYDVSPSGNFEHGQSILNLPKTIAQTASLRGWNLDELLTELNQSRAELLAARDQRIRPGKDDKILVSWNALMIDAFAQAAGVLQEPRYLAAAQRAARFVLANLRKRDGRLLHSWRNGQAKFDAYLDDYANLTNALVSLYEADFDPFWIECAVELAETLLARFLDTVEGGFFFTADDHEQLIARNKDLHDSSVPSGNAMAAHALLRLGKLTGRADLLSAAEGALRCGAGVMERSPSAAGQMLVALDAYTSGAPELVLVGDLHHPAVQAALSRIRRRFIPGAVVAAAESSAAAGSPHLRDLFAGKTPSQTGVALYICRNFTCKASLTDPAEISAAIDALAQPGE